MKQYRALVVHSFSLPVRLHWLCCQARCFARPRDISGPMDFMRPRAVGGRVVFAVFASANGPVREVCDAPNFLSRRFCVMPGKPITTAKHRSCKTLAYLVSGPCWVVKKMLAYQFLVSTRRFANHIVPVDIMKRRMAV
jgi:hypothetical protein